MNRPINPQTVRHAPTTEPILLEHTWRDYVPVHYLMSIVAHICWNPYSLSQCTHLHLQFERPLIKQCMAYYKRVIQCDKSVATYQYKFVCQFPTDYILNLHIL